MLHSGRSATKSTFESREIFWAMIGASGPSSAWMCQRAVMGKSRSENNFSMLGLIVTAKPSPWGPRLHFELLLDRVTRTAACRILETYLDEFWSVPRIAPDHYVLDSHTLDRVEDETRIHRGDALLVEQLFFTVPRSNRWAKEVLRACEGRHVRLAAPEDERAVLFQAPQRPEHDENQWFLFRRFPAARGVAGVVCTRSWYGEFMTPHPREPGVQWRHYCDLLERLENNRKHSDE